jgi:hypothetical protein
MRLASMLRGPAIVAALALLVSGTAGAASQAPAVTGLELGGSLALGLSVRITLLVLCFQLLVGALVWIGKEERLGKGIAATAAAYGLLHLCWWLG